ncbi:MAG: exodeoxyribonuclease VII small subunit [Planctomycetaceae bacterium]|nr:exodeoxyribonuclease VII small subunit [Planctomycetaceae bacterium]
MNSITETSNPSNFEQSLAELQRIVADLESGALGLEQSLAQFERGIGLLRQCRTVLEQAEQRIEVLTGVNSQGNPTFAPFDATATAEQQGKSAGRRPRRKAKAAEAEPDVSPPTVAPAPATGVEEANATATDQVPPWEPLTGGNDTGSSIDASSHESTDSDDSPRLF